MNITLKMMRKMPLNFQEDWHVVDEIGAGSFGSVFRIENMRGQVCALKVIPVPMSEDELSDQLAQYGGDVELTVQEFDRVIESIMQREIGTAQQCAECPNVFDIYEKVVLTDANNPMQRYVLVRMELLRDLNAHMRRAGTRQRDVLRMMEDISSALVFMKGRGIIHRDIKPANIMVDDAGRYKLTDFGEARVIRDNGSQTVARGTPFYMAPETNTDKYDSRADIYSLGMVAYYFLNGFRYPFEQNGVGAREGYRRRMRGEICPLIAQVDPAINRILAKCVAPSPDQRYAHPSELLRDIRNLLRDNMVGEQPLLSGTMPNNSPSGVGNSADNTEKGLSPQAIVLIVVGVTLLIVIFAAAIASTSPRGIVPVYGAGICAPAGTATMGID